MRSSRITKSRQEWSSSFSQHAIAHTQTRVHTERSMEQARRGSHCSAWPSSQRFIERWSAFRPGQWKSLRDWWEKPSWNSSQPVKPTASSYCLRCWPACNATEGNYWSFCFFKLTQGRVLFQCAVVCALPVADGTKSENVVLEVQRFSEVLIKAADE